MKQSAHVGRSREARRPVVVTLLVAGLAAGCVTRAVVPPPANADSAGAGIEVTLRGPLGFPTYDADVVHFARVDPVTARAGTSLLSTGHARAGRAYLMDVPPGEYVAVAATFSVLGAPDRYITSFPAALVDATRTRVVPGRFAYAGRYVVAMSIGVCAGEADEGQVRLAELFEPGVPKCGFLDSVGSKLARTRVAPGGVATPPAGGFTYHYRGTLASAVRDDASESDFARQAARDLGNAGWGAIVGR